MDIDRREFIYLSSLSIFGMGSSLERGEDVELEIKIYKNEEADLFISDTQEEYIQSILGKSLSTLSTEDVKVKPLISFSDNIVNIEEEQPTIKDILGEWVKNLRGRDNRATHSNILLMGHNSDIDKVGRARYGCPGCTRGGIVLGVQSMGYLPDNGSLNDMRFDSDNIGLGKIIDIIHEIGHNLNLRHHDGTAFVDNKKEIVVTPMMSGYYNDFKDNHNIPSVKTPNISYSLEFNEDITTIQRRLY
jgi:hypothetical protein